MSTNKNINSREVPKLPSEDDKVDWALFQFRIRTSLSGKKKADRVIGATRPEINEEHYHNLLADDGVETRRSENYLYELRRNQRIHDTDEVLLFSTLVQGCELNETALAHAQKVKFGDGNSLFNELKEEFEAKDSNILRSLLAGFGDLHQERTKVPPSLRPWIREIEKAAKQIKIHGHTLSPDTKMLSTLMAGMHSEAFRLALSMTEGLSWKNATRRMIIYDNSRKLTTAKKSSSPSLNPEMSEGELKRKLDDISAHIANFAP
jgi:hypothetical protein